MKENCGCSLNKSIIKKVGKFFFFLITVDFALFQTSFPRQANGTCSTNGVLKNFSVNSDENERGVTFRVGKFIGQVTIESKIQITNTTTNQNLPSQSDQTTNFLSRIQIQSSQHTTTPLSLFFILFLSIFFKQIQRKILKFQRLNFAKKRPNRPNLLLSFQVFI